MVEPLVVMYPDYQGKGSLGEFGKKLLALGRNLKLVPVLNGLPMSELCDLERKIEAMDARLDAFPTPARGLRSTLVHGYQHVLRTYPESVVIRLDTDEHPVDHILSLTGTAAGNGGMAIGDLDFAEGKLVANSPDELAHLNVFPILYGQFTAGKLPLSCAHGFQGFYPSVLGRILDGAIAIAKAAGSEFVGQDIEWGFDGAMALSAYKLGIPTTIIKVPAEKIRNRDRQKIADQFDRALRMCRASVRANLEPEPVRRCI